MKTGNLTVSNLSVYVLNRRSLTHAAVCQTVNTKARVQAQFNACGIYYRYVDAKTDFGTRMSVPAANIISPIIHIHLFMQHLNI